MNSATPQLTRWALCDSCQNYITDPVALTKVFTAIGRNKILPEGLDIHVFGETRYGDEDYDLEDVFSGKLAKIQALPDGRLRFVTENLQEACASMTDISHCWQKIIDDSLEISERQKVVLQSLLYHGSAAAAS